MPGNTAPIPNGYNGLNWNNFWDLNGDTYPLNPSGYQAGTVSHSNVAFNAFASPASFSSNTAFNFNSVYLTGAWNDGLNIEVQGFNGVNLIYDQNVTVNSTSPTLFNFNYLNVTEVNFIPLSSEDWFAMDNLTINGQGVPDGGTTISLLGCALLGVAVLRRKFGKLSVVKK